MNDWEILLVRQHSAPATPRSPTASEHFVARLEPAAFCGGGSRKWVMASSGPTLLVTFQTRQLQIKQARESQSREDGFGDLDQCWTAAGRNPFPTATTTKSRRL